eukprot:TRINITY_DN55832_c0_g1_i1.p1 TRINITY_DN55832_c0_g1~~TRINITY_DN55832_c0_g1_i1.p1  ORF type:complete len:564 (-),score=46.81 TRINITY_DN55832_c0_g1_i1:661-2352(-)
MGMFTNAVIAWTRFQTDPDYRIRLLHNCVLCTLVAIFGISSWATTNSVWTEVPIYGVKLPEKYEIAALLTVAIASANIFVLVYGVVVRFVARPPLPVIIYCLLATLVVCTAFFAWSWDKTATIGGKDHSVGIVINMFVAGGVDCLTSVVYWPFIAQYPARFAVALAAGESLSSSVCGVIGLIQDPSNPRFSVEVFFVVFTVIVSLSGFAFVIIRTFYALDGPRFRQILANPAPTAQLGVSMNALPSSVPLQPSASSSTSTQLPTTLKKRERQGSSQQQLGADASSSSSSSTLPIQEAADGPSDVQGDGPAADGPADPFGGDMFGASPKTVQRQQQQQIQNITSSFCSSANLSFSKEDGITDANESALRDEETTGEGGLLEASTFNSWNPMISLSPLSVGYLLQFVLINGIQNGVLPSLSTYFFQQFTHSQKLLSLSINLGAILNPLASALPGLLSFPYTSILCGTYMVLTSYIVYNSVTADPVMAKQTYGGLVMLLIVLCNAILISYTKANLFILLKKELPTKKHKLAFTWAGYCTQVGSFVFAVVMFFLITVAQVQDHGKKA